MLPVTGEVRDGVTLKGCYFCPKHTEKIVEMAQERNAGLHVNLSVFEYPMLKTRAEREIVQKRMRDVSEKRLRATEAQSQQIITELAGRLGQGEHAVRSREEARSIAASRFAAMQGEFNAELHSSQFALEESNAQIRAEAIGVIGAGDQRYRETVELAEIRHKQIVTETAAQDEETKRMMQQAFIRREQTLTTEISYGVLRRELSMR